MFIISRVRIGCFYPKLDIIIFSRLYMEYLEFLEHVFKDVWLRNYDSLKVNKWAILWRKCMHRIVVRVSFMQY